MAADKVNVPTLETKINQLLEQMQQMNKRLSTLEQELKQKNQAKQTVDSKGDPVPAKKAKKCMACNGSGKTIDRGGNDEDGWTCREVICFDCHGKKYIVEYEFE